MTKERPILFSGAMVRAILDGRKTQTRRVLKQATGPSLSVNCEDGVAELSWLHGAGPGHEVHETIKRVACPYGMPGERLWVREAFMHEPADYCWEASVSIPCRPAVTTYRADSDPEGTAKGAGWKPSIHMPRALSRMTLEVTGVRVERLNDCSETDAASEGVEPIDTERYDEDWSICGRCGGTRLYTAYSGQGGALPGTDCLDCDTHLKRYTQLWDSINGDGAWAANPYVWVVEFRRIADADQA